MDQAILQDPEIANAIILESDRQMNHLELIASENFVSAAVREAQGSILTHKYAEGYPSKRYYGGCEFVDMVENLAIDRVKKLFNAEYANVQPHSGSQANMAVYNTLLKPGGKILGMNLTHGGHLTHGSPVNFSGKLYDIIPYGVVRETGLIDYDALLALAKEHRPDVIIAGSSAYPRIIDFARFRQIADLVNAKLIVDMAHIAGLVATGLHPSPIPHAHVITSTTHKTLRGPRGGLILSSEEYGQNLNSQIFPGIQGGPLMHVIAAKAVSFGEALRPSFYDYQKHVVKNAHVLAEALQSKGFNLVSGGTDTHLLLIDLQNKNITGKECEGVLDSAGIAVNKNSIPFETRSLFITSGIRLGTAALTTRGMKEDAMIRLADWIDDAVKHHDNSSRLMAIREEIAVFARQYPLFTW